MKRFFVVALLALLALGFSSQLSYAQSTTGLSGKAVRWNGEPIVGATISVLAGPLESDQEYGRAITAADGSWSVSVPAGGPYWVHIHTFGSWWGYSYQDPFTLVNGEQVSQIYLALGPREVNEIALPTPESSVAPALGSNEEAPSGEVAGVIGESGQMPQNMPNTGENDGAALIVLFGAAAMLFAAGMSLRKRAQQF